MMMHPYTLIQLGMHGDASNGGVDRYFWGLNQGLQRASTNLDTHGFFFGEDSPQKSSGYTSLGREDLPLHQRLFLLRKRVLRSKEYIPCRLVLASHFALYALPVLFETSNLTHVIHFHGPWAQESSMRGQSKLSVLAKKTVERFVYRKADAFITLSNAFRDLLVSNYGVSRDKVHVVPGAVDTSRFEPSDKLASRDLLGWPRDQRIIFCVRRLVERMGIEALVTAFAAIAAKYPEVSLFIGGKGPLEENFRTQIRTLGLDSRVRILGFIPESLLPTHYQAADISIVPSQSLEGFGLTTIESLACGTPVLVTPVGGLAEVIQPLAPSCILSGTNPEQIAEGLHAYLADQLPLPTAADCVGYVEKNFLWEKVARKVLTIYDNAFLAKHRGVAVAKTGRSDTGT
jgi:glycosyltransferase involved in cell wall biosynthesis